MTYPDHPALGLVYSNQLVELSELLQAQNDGEGYGSDASSDDDGDDDDEPPPLIPYYGDLLEDGDDGDDEGSEPDEANTGDRNASGPSTSLPAPPLAQGARGGPNVPSEDFPKIIQAHHETVTGTHSSPYPCLAS